MSIKWRLEGGVLPTGYNQGPSQTCIRFSANRVIPPAAHRPQRPTARAISALRTTVFFSLHTPPSPLQCDSHPLRQFRAYDDLYQRALLVPVNRSSHIWPRRFWVYSVHYCFRLVLEVCRVAYFLTRLTVKPISHPLFLLIPMYGIAGLHSFVLCWIEKTWNFFLLTNCASIGLARHKLSCRSQTWLSLRASSTSRHRPRTTLPTACTTLQCYH